jgi:hypothetical protein
LQGLVQKYADALLTEAERIEAVTNSTGSAELTSQMLRDADLFLRRGYARAPRRARDKIPQLLAAVGAFVVGILSNETFLSSPGKLAAYVALLAITITATVVAVLKD